MRWASVNKRELGGSHLLDLQRDGPPTPEHAQHTYENCTSGRKELFDLCGVFELLAPVERAGMGGEDWAGVEDAHGLEGRHPGLALVVG